jgi:hypothetical protein
MWPSDHHSTYHRKVDLIFEFVMQFLHDGIKRVTPTAEWVIHIDDIRASGLRLREQGTNQQAAYDTFLQILAMSKGGIIRLLWRIWRCAR